MIGRIKYKLNKLQSIYEEIEKIRTTQEDYLRDTNTSLGHQLRDLSNDLWDKIQDLEKDKLLYNCQHGLCVHKKT